MKMLPTEIASAELARLLAVTPRAVTDLAKRGIVVRGKRRGTYAVEASVSGYCRHLRDMAAGRGGEAGATARERLGQAQATLAEVKAKQLAGELVEVEAVETFWRGKLKSFRNRILAVPSRVGNLDAKQDAGLMRELRDCLDELASAK